jgi:DNA-directed RNA polymerase subunit RPC12/RpoP
VTVDALDGNAIAGPLLEHFGIEMTTVRGSCANCGASAQIAELRVYMRGPGAVVRCPACGSVVIVLVRIRDALRIHDSGFKLASGLSQHSV